MKKLIIFFLLPFALLLFGCDAIVGVDMHVYNITIPIERVFFDIFESKDVLGYDEVELLYAPPSESFEIFPKWGKQISEAYYYISIKVYGSDGKMRFWPIVKYINSDKAYLYLYNWQMHNMQDDVREFSLHKMNELKQFLKEKYGLADEDIVIEKIGHGW